MPKASGCPRMETARFIQPSYEPTVGKALPLRYLYGCLTYLDTEPDHSPVGTYQEFLRDLGKEKASELMLSDVFMFLQRAAGMERDQKCVVSILIDEINSCSGQFPGTQVSFHLKLADARMAARGSYIISSKMKGLHERSHLCL